MNFLFSRKKNTSSGTNRLADFTLREIDGLFNDKKTVSATNRIAFTGYFSCESSRTAQKFALELTELNWEAVYFKNKLKNCQVKVNAVLTPFEEVQVKTRVNELYQTSLKHNCVCTDWNWEFV